DETDSVARGSPRRRDHWRPPPEETALCWRQHRLHLAQALRQHAQHPGLARERLQAAALVQPQPDTSQDEQLRATKDRPEDGAAAGLLGRIDGLGDGARGFDDRTVLHTRGARGLTGTAVQAGEDVLSKVQVVRADLALVYLADLVDASTRRVRLVAQDAVRRAVVQTQPAMDALLEQLLVEQLVELRYRQRSVLDSTCHVGRAGPGWRASAPRSSLAPPTRRAAASAQLDNA